MRKSCKSAGTLLQKVNKWGKILKCKCSRRSGAHILGEPTHVKETSLLLTLLQNTHAV